MGEHRGASRMVAGRAIGPVQCLGQGAADQEAERQHEGADPKAMRQPFVSTNAALRVAARIAPDRATDQEAIDWLAACQEPISPRRPRRREPRSGRPSPGPSSPPSAKPWISQEADRQDRCGIADLGIARRCGEPDDGDPHQREESGSSPPAARPGRRAGR